MLGAWSSFAPTCVGAQENRRVSVEVDQATPVSACHGFAIDHFDPVSRRGDSTYSIVAHLDPQSPAGLAGIANGDTVVTLNGVAGGWPEQSSWKDNPGDTNSVRVKGRGEIRDVSFAVGTYVSLPLRVIVSDRLFGWNREAFPELYVCRPRI
jgi:hypothetical protein